MSEKVAAQDVLELYNNQGGLCAITGAPMTMDGRFGVARINSLLPHTLDNVFVSPSHDGGNGSNDTNAATAIAMRFDVARADNQLPHTAANCDTASPANAATAAIAMRFSVTRADNQLPHCTANCLASPAFASDGEEADA